MTGMELSYNTQFCMGHIIKDHPKCGVMHGHNYNLTVTIRYLDEKVFIDFADLKKVVESWCDMFDHTFSGHKLTPAQFVDWYMKQSGYGEDAVPKLLSISAEKLASKVRFWVNDHMKNIRTEETKVEIWETAKFKATAM